jgi:isopentenyl-diphosphate delta-isomerase
MLGRIARTCGPLVQRRAATHLSVARASTATLQSVLDGADATQKILMEERCILIDENDQVIGSESKLNCHLNDLGPPLHRAFSVFLFNSDGKMLIQRRAEEKVLFPLYWTNTCCSHPLHTEAELGNLDGGDAIMGATR